MTVRQEPRQRDNRRDEIAIKDMTYAEFAAKMGEITEALSIKREEMVRACRVGSLSEIRRVYQEMAKLDRKAIRLARTWGHH